ncbi:hypothetical protein Tco_0957806 [Tanacetum coccineum]
MPSEELPVLVQPLLPRVDLVFIHGVHYHSVVLLSWTTSSYESRCLTSESWAMTSGHKADKISQVVAYKPIPKQKTLSKEENPKKDQACHPTATVKRTAIYGKQYLHMAMSTAAVEAFLKCKNGIVQHLTSPFTPKTNGVSEWRNAIIRYGTVDKEPYEIWHGKVPKFVLFKGRGCEAYVKRDSADKLNRDYFLDRDLISSRIQWERLDLEDDSFGLPSENTSVEDDVVGDLGEPANYKAVMLDPDKVIWQGAMDEEMNSMKVNEVWIEVDPPSNAKVVRSKWLFKKKDNWIGFCDASWQCDKDDTKSQTGYVFVVNGGAIDWKSKKQTMIAMSEQNSCIHGLLLKMLWRLFGIG